MRPHGEKIDAPDWWWVQKTGQDFQHLDKDEMDERQWDEEIVVRL
jgi:hypothetical protein